MTSSWPCGQPQGGRPHPPPALAPIRPSVEQASQQGLARRVLCEVSNEVTSVKCLGRAGDTVSTVCLLNSVH